MGKKIASLTALIFSDFLVLLISFWLAYLIRRYLLTSLFPVLESAPLYPYSHFLNHFYMAVVWIFIFAYEKLYTKRYPIWSEVRVSIKSATLSSFVIMGAY